jgi:hypothetical protein
MGIHGWYFGGEVCACTSYLLVATPFFLNLPTQCPMCEYLLKIFSDGCLGSGNDEGRSEVR